MSGASLALGDSPSEGVIWVESSSGTRKVFAVDEATAKSITEQLWPPFTDAEAHWMAAMSLATGIADSPTAVWADPGGDLKYLVVDAHLFIARLISDGVDDGQSLGLIAKPLSAQTWAVERKSEAASLGFTGQPGIKTRWDFRCDDGEKLTVEGEIVIRARELPGEINEAELFARQVARQLGWQVDIP